MSRQVCNAEPTFIEESKELGILRQIATGTLLQNKCQIGHIHMAFDILKQCLYQMYNHTNISILVQNSVYVAEASKFSNFAREAVRFAEWSKSTIRTILSILKKILTFTAISREFLRKITLREVSEPYTIELGKRYGSMDRDDPIRVRLDNWLSIVKTHGRCKSKQSLRNIMRFILNHCVPGFSLDINAVPDETSDYIGKRLNAATVQKICGHSNVSTKRNWLLIFVRDIMKCQKPLEDSWFRIEQKRHGDPTQIDDGSDKHRILTSELEQLHAASENSVLDRLIFMIMLTTGMRIGGLINIKTEHVAHINGTDVIVQNTGRTLEKGSKWVTFIIAQPVQQLIFQWITSYRPAIDSPYLFPGRNGQISTGNVRYRFKHLVQRAGLSGPHLHPHALRHTFAHMMLKTGNAVETVAKLLNHANPKTTQQFYLKESAIEVASRANIPWLDKSNIPSEPVIPKFLSKQSHNEEIDKTSKRNTKRRRKAMASLDMFNKKKSGDLEIGE